MAASEPNTRPRWLELAEQNSGGVITVQPGARVGEAPTEKKPATEKKPELSVTIVRLPMWPAAVRAAPNGVLRSALFGVAERGGSNQLMVVEHIASVEGIELFYTGPRLDQTDFDVYQALLHLCRHQAMGERCEFTAHELLRALGRCDTGGARGSRKVLDRQLSRMNATAVRIKVGRYSYEGSLIGEIARDEATKRYVVVVNPKLRPLFEVDQYTQLDWEVRRALMGKPFAQWLHGFYSSHAEPFALSLDKLRELSGSKSTQRFHFKAKLVKALGELAKALEANGQPFVYGIEGELVHVTRTPSRSQRKSLARRKDSIHS